MKLIYLIVTLLLTSQQVVSGELVRGATITEIASSSSNQDVFYLKLSGGTGLCSGQYIIFPASKSQSKESYNQAFSIALTAAASGKKIRAHNYEDDSCRGANFIGMFTQ